MAQIGYKGIYENMKFEPYVYREYPKLVKDKWGEDRLVHNAREELAIAQEPDPDATSGVPPIFQERDKLAEDNAKMQAQIAELEAKLATLADQAGKASDEAKAASDPFRKLKIPKPGVGGDLEPPINK